MQNCTGLGEGDASISASSASSVRDATVVIDGVGAHVIRHYSELEGLEERLGKFEAGLHRILSAVKQDWDKNEVS